MQDIAVMNGGVQTETAVSKQKPKRRIARKLGYGLLGLGLVLVVAHFVWVGSGANQWVLDREEDGIKLWTLKSPGTGLIQVKAEVTMKSKLAGMVKMLEELDDSADAFTYDVSVLREIESTPGNRAIYSRFKFDFKVPGVAPRDYVLFSERFQDLDTKKLEINLMAAPDMAPRDPCCVRVTHLHNNWKLTPLQNGELNVVFTQDTDDGGIPYVFQNILLKEGTVMILQQMRELMKQDKYMQAQVASISELDAS
jgi:hypothetical protein